MRKKATAAIQKVCVELWFVFERFFSNVGIFGVENSNLADYVTPSYIVL